MLEKWFKMLFKISDVFITIEHVILVFRVDFQESIS